MKYYLILCSFLIISFLNFLNLIGIFSFSIYGINYSFNFLEIEIKNYINNYIEKERFILKYSENEEHLNLIWENIYKNQIEQIENGLDYNFYENWNIFLEEKAIYIIDDETNYYTKFLEMLLIPISFLRYNDPKILNNSDFKLIYSNKAFKKIKNYNKNDSIFLQDFWYDSTTTFNYYGYLSESLEVFLTFIEQLMYKQINEEIAIFNEDITITKMIEIQNRISTIPNFEFYKVEFSKYIKNSYFNSFFLLILLPILSFWMLVFLLLILFYLPRIVEILKIRLKFIHSFSYK